MKEDVKYINLDDSNYNELHSLINKFKCNYIYLITEKTNLDLTVNTKTVVKEIKIEATNLNELKIPYNFHNLYIYNSDNLNCIKGKCINCNFSFCKNINFNQDFFKSVEILHINSYKGKVDISNMSSLKELSLSFCDDLSGLNRNNTVTKLILEFLDIEDINFISNFTMLQDIIISNCSKLSCIDVLKSFNLNSIEIQHCDKLKDVDFYNLRNAKKIAIRYCPCFKDVSMFTDIEELDFSGCVNIKNLTSLERNGKLRYLNLSYTNIRHVFSFRNVYKLVLRGCKKIKCVKGLDNVKLLDLYDCTGIEDFSGLSNNIYLNLVNTNFFKNTENFKYIQNIENVELSKETDMLPNHVLLEGESIIYSKNFL